MTATTTPAWHVAYDPRSEADIRAAAEALVRQAQELGVVLTIEQRALQPLRQGHYETVVMVRAARGRG